MSTQEADDRQRSLHGKASDVGGFPLCEQRAVVEAEAGGLLDGVYVDRRAGEDGGDGEGELAGEHRDVPRPEVWRIDGLSIVARQGRGLRKRSRAGHFPGAGGSNFV